MARSRSRSEPRRITLGDDLRIAHAREAFEALLGAAPGAHVEIDGSRVERVDGAGLQSLAARLARLRAAQVRVRWAGTSPALAASAALAGLDRALELA